jgi:hypothetical protein
MDLNDSTQGPMMVFCEHLQTVGSTKLGSFFTSYQVFKKDPASWSYLYCIHKKKLLWIEGVMTLWHPEFCLLFYCPPLLSVNRQKVLVTTSIPCNMCNMPGRDYKELLYAGDGNEQPKEKYRGAIYVTSFCDLSIVTVPYPFFGLAEGYLLFPSPITASLLVCQQQL